MRPKAASIALIAALIALPALALACPTCKDAFENSPEAKGFAKGIYYSIILMFGVLFSVVGVIIYKIVQEARRGPGQAPTP